MFSALLSLLVLLIPLGVAAQDHAPRAALIRTEIPDATLEDFGRAIDRVLRARVQHHDVVRLDATPALGLEDIQLMVGCLNESAECYAAFAEQLEAEVLFFSSLERAGDEYIISVRVFDARASEERAATRRADDAAVEESLIGAIDGMVRELFGLPAASGPSVTQLATNADATQITRSTNEPSDGGAATETTWQPSWAGVGVAVVGVVAVGAGAAVFVLGQNDEDAYLAAPVGTRVEIDSALDLRDQAESKMSAGLGTMLGGAALAALGVSLTFALGEDVPVQTSALVGPGTAGVQLAGSF